MQSQLNLFLVNCTTLFHLPTLKFFCFVFFGELILLLLFFLHREMDSCRIESMRSAGPSSEEIPLIPMTSVLDRQKRAQDLSLLSLLSATSQNFDTAPVDVTVGMGKMFKSAPYQ